MTPSKLLRGIVLMMTSCALFTLSWMGIKSVSTLPLVEIVFFRGFFSLLILLAIVVHQKHSLQPKSYSSLLLRSVFGITSMYLHFYSLRKIEIGNASALLNTVPIFIAVFSPLILGERFVRKKFVFLLVAFFGVCLIVKPNQHLFSNGSLYSLSAGFFGALAMVYIRKLHASVSTMVITFYFTLGATVSGFIPLYWNFRWPSLTEWGILWGIGISITAAQLTLTKSYFYGDASHISPFHYTAVLFSYLAGLVFWNEIPDIWSLLGAGIVISSGMVIMLTGKHQTASVSVQKEMFSPIVPSL